MPVWQVSSHSQVGWPLAAERLDAWCLRSPERILDKICWVWAGSWGFWKGAGGVLGVLERSWELLGVSEAVLGWVVGGPGGVLRGHAGGPGGS